MTKILQFPSKKPSEIAPDSSDVDIYAEIAIEIDAQGKVSIKRSGEDTVEADIRLAKAVSAMQALIQGMAHN